MERLQKKCVIASAGVHLLLMAILFLGPGFIAPKPPPDNTPVIDFIPFKTVDALVTGGGNPNVRTLPAPAPVQPVVKPVPAPPPPAPEIKPKPQPRPEPVKIKEPEPDPEPRRPVVKPLRNDPDGFEPPVKETRRKPDISTDIIESKPDLAKQKAEAKKRAQRLERQRKQRELREQEEREREDAEAYARAWADARRRAADRVGSMANNIDGMSSSTEIELPGPGGGGLPYANFLQAVKSLYAREWHAPSGVTDEQAVTTASVTIGRDGTVITHRIDRYSGNRDVDRSVSEVLYRVKKVAPLPDDAKEDERTVTINFKAIPKKGIG